MVDEDKVEEKVEEKHDCLCLGILLTFAIFLLFLIMCMVRKDDLATLTLNAWGDTFAGFAGMIALVWLIIGYYQNSKALLLQQKELRLSIIEIQKVSQANERNRETIIAVHDEKMKQDAKLAKPDLTFQTFSQNIEGTSFNYRNIGGGAKVICINVFKDVGPQYEIEINPPSYMGSDGTIRFHPKEKGAAIKHACFQINYRDTMGNEGWLKYLYVDKTCTPLKDD